MTAAISEILTGDKSGDRYVVIRDTPAVGDNGFEWGDPVPLPDTLSPVEAFEPALLPEAFRPWIMDVAERMQCPPDYPAVASMIALSATVGRQVAIRPKRRDNWTVVPNLWGAVVGRPGVMKTPALQEPMRPLSRLEANARTTFEAEMLEWKADHLIAQEQKKVAADGIRKALKNNENPKSIAENALASDESQPTRARYIVNDSTVEKLGELLNENPRGLLVFRDELTGLLRSLDKEGHEAARAFYLEAWNGDKPFVYDRIGRGTIDIESACVSILGGIQPGPFSEYVTNALKGGAADDGLIQRFQLLVWPDIGSTWRNVDRWPDKDAEANANQVFDRLNTISAGEIGAMADDERPIYLRFDDAAQELFTEWQTGLEIRLRASDLPPVMEAHLAKYRSLIPALALLLHLADEGRGSVGLDSLERALAWGEYLESHAQRVYSPAIAPDVAAAGRLLKKMSKDQLDNPFTIRDVYRHGWSGLNNQSVVESAANVLSDHNYVIGTVIDTGGLSKTVYHVNPKLHGVG